MNGKYLEKNEEEKAKCYLEYSKNSSQAFIQIVNFPICYKFKVMEIC